MNQAQDQEKFVEEVWRTYMTTGKVLPGVEHSRLHGLLQPVMTSFPADQRCRICRYPFDGWSGKLTQAILDLRPSKLNPSLCNICERFANELHGGAEVETTVLFVDVRGSTTLAEQQSPMEFGKLINRFYNVTTGALFKHHAMIEKLIGDEVTGFFVPGFSGEHHAADAIKAARDVLKDTGYGDPEGPWIPVGIGVHTGLAFIGSVTNQEGQADVVVLGDSVNTGARITAQAASGEIIVSEAALANAGEDGSAYEKRRLELKGKSEPVDVRVITLGM